MSGTTRSGRKSVPTTLKLLRGNPGRRPLNATEPAPPKPARLPPPPPELSDAAKKEWRKTGKQLLAVGLLTTLDTAQFAAYCQTYARWLDVSATLAKTSVLIKGQRGELIANPLLRIARDLQIQFTRALLEFGMSPSSRSRINATPTEKEEDPFDAWQRT